MGTEAPTFESLCREHQIDGTPMARLCELFWVAGGRKALEEAAAEAESWHGSKAALAAGEMSMQERRTVRAITFGIGAAIRALAGKPAT